MHHLPYPITLVKFSKFGCWPLPPLCFAAVSGFAMFCHSSTCQVQLNRICFQNLVAGLFMSIFSRGTAPAKENSRWPFQPLMATGGRPAQPYPNEETKSIKMSILAFGIIPAQVPPVAPLFASSGLSGLSRSCFRRWLHRQRGSPRISGEGCGSYLWHAWPC